ncbi:hypothetical protein TpMuguga_01g01139 [Theileria parva strain Muguga]|uniref:uncharacterized protein n=1 Tax=Theileria parva strain Muguga TaxID=333668 RepID=UPI001C61F784|nr:uncharacterized protein TpMuguga_01g01139 [Theileria parva strain Muguga]EAN34377.2 hypothetical protein TpMuguga_01g01139 [Theileria parva strain Muguga]
MATGLDLSKEAIDDLEIHEEDISDFILGEDLAFGSESGQQSSGPDPSLDPAPEQGGSTKEDKNCPVNSQIQEQNVTAGDDKDSASTSTSSTCSNIEFNSLCNLLTINTNNGIDEAHDSTNNDEILNRMKIEELVRRHLESMNQSIGRQVAGSEGIKRVQEDRECLSESSWTTNKVERLLDELPKIEGIVYEPEFKCFKSRIPPRYCKYSEESSFSAKRYGLKNAWLKAVSHLFTSIASSVFDFPPVTQSSGGHSPEAMGRPSTGTYGVPRSVPEIRENKARVGPDDMGNLDYDSFYDLRHKKIKVSDLELKNIKNIKRFMINEIDTENLEDKGYEALLFSSRTNNKHVLSLEEQNDPKKIAESLKPWHQWVNWVPSISRWRTLYYDENSVKHTKTFTPAIFGGVKEAYYAAVEFRNMIDNMDQLTLPTIRRNWIKSNGPSTNKRSPTLTEDKFGSPEPKVENISKSNSNFNFSIQTNNSHTPVNCTQNPQISNNTTDTVNSTQNTQNTQNPPDNLGNNCHNTDNNSPNVENKNCNNNMGKDLQNDENPSNNSKEEVQNNMSTGVDIDFLSGLDTKGLFIPIPLDWKRD